MNFLTKEFSKSIFDFILRIAFVSLLVISAYNILSAFVSLIIWSLIITIALVPLHNRVSGWLGNRKKLASALITVVFLSLIIGPFGFVVKALIDNLKELSETFSIENISHMQPDESIKEWPVVGDKIYGGLVELTQNQEKFIEHYKPQLLAVGEFMLNTITSAGKSVLLFFGAMLISGFLLVFTSQRQSLGLEIGNRLAGEDGKNLASLIEKTIRSVVTGVLGVAVIQAILAGIGFFIMGIPFAGLWTVAALFLAMMQIGVGPVAIGAIVYAFAYQDTTPAIIFLVWNLFVMVSDNILKPFLMGRGLDVPLLIIFMGAIGGMLNSGILGLFLGPVILAVVYQLFKKWLNQNNDQETEIAEEQTEAQHI